MVIPPGRLEARAAEGSPAATLILDEATCADPPTPLTTGMEALAAEDAAWLWAYVPDSAARTKEAL